MEPERSLPHLQEPATCPYAEPNRSIACPHPTSRRSILILSPYLRPGLASRLLPSSFPTKTLYAPLLTSTRVTCPAHLSLLDVITRMMFGEVE